MCKDRKYIDVDLLFRAIMNINAKTRKVKMKYPNPYFMNTNLLL